MLKSSPLKHKEGPGSGGHLIMTEAAHAAQHGGEVDEQDSDDTMFGLEVDIFKPKKEEEKKKVDESTTFRLLTEQEEEELYPSTETVIAKGIDDEDIEIEQPIKFEKPKSKMVIDRRIDTHWEDDEINNYKRKNSKWYKSVNGEEVEAFTKEKMSKKERAKLNDLNKTLYTGEINLNDVETWRNRDEKTIVSKITSSNLFLGAIGEDIGPMAKITLPNGEEYTSDPDAEEGAKYKPTQNHGLPITELGKKVQNFYKNTDKDPDLLSSLQFRDANQLRRSWGKLGYKVETTPNSLAKGGQDIVLKDKNDKELASGDINDIKKYLYNNASEKDVERLKILSIEEAQKNIAAVNIKKKKLNTSEVQREAKENYLENSFKKELMFTLANSPLSQPTIDKIDSYYNQNLVKPGGDINIASNKMNMLNGKSFTDLSHVIQGLKAIKPGDETYDQAQAEIKILQNLVPRLDKNIKTGILKAKNEIIDKSAETYQAQLYRKNKDAILAKMGVEIMEREDTKEKTEIDGAVDMMLDNYDKDLNKFQTSISSLASDAAKDGVSVSYDVDNFQVTGENTEKVNFYANKFSVLNDAIKKSIDDYSETQKNYTKKYNDWQNNYKDVLQLQDKTSRENRLAQMNMSKLNDGFRSMAYSALSLVDEDKAIAKTKSMREGQEIGLEKALDYRTAIETGQKWRFATGELSTQGANVIVAVASGGIGMGAGLGTVGTGMLTGYGVFGTYTGLQKGIDLEMQRQAGEEAKLRLNGLEKNKFMYTPQDYMRTKMQLNEAIAYGDISDSDKAKSMLATFAIEGTITSFLGTVPNSINLIRKFKFFNIISASSP